MELKNNLVLDHYDAGHLNDFGGGNVNWWQDYIRNELERAHDFYQQQLDSSAPPIDQEPVAYAVFSDSGNIRIWCADPAQSQALRDKFGNDLRPLYAAPPESPDVTALVDLLAECRESINDVVETPSGPELEPEHSVHARALVENIDAALSAYRKAQGGDVHDSK